MAGGHWLTPKAVGPPFQNARLISEKDMKKCCLIGCFHNFSKEIEKFTINIKGCLKENLKFGQLSSINGVFVGDHQWC
jgi:hypothetical protein